MQTGDLYFKMSLLLVPRLYIANQLIVCEFWMFYSTSNTSDNSAICGLNKFVQILIGLMVHLSEILRTSANVSVCSENSSNAAFGAQTSVLSFPSCSFSCRDLSKASFVESANSFQYSIVSSLTHSVASQWPLRTSYPFFFRKLSLRDHPEHHVPDKKFRPNYKKNRRSTANTVKL